jgi:hypothetical protein
MKSRMNETYSQWKTDCQGCKVCLRSSRSRNQWLEMIISVPPSTDEQLTLNCQSLIHKSDPIQRLKFCSSWNLPSLSYLELMNLTLNSFSLKFNDVWSFSTSKPRSWSCLCPQASQRTDGFYRIFPWYRSIDSMLRQWTIINSQPVLTCFANPFQHPPQWSKSKRENSDPHLPPNRDLIGFTQNSRPRFVCGSWSAFGFRPMKWIGEQQRVKDKWLATGTQPGSGRIMENRENDSESENPQ